LKLDAQALKEIKECEDSLKSVFSKIDETALLNQSKVIEAMQQTRLSERHFAMSTGYGYNDAGRETVEEIFAQVFGAEKALVRPQIVSGTHAIALALFGVLRPGDELLSLTGSPYDTVATLIGADSQEKGQGTLSEYGIAYREADFSVSGINVNIKGLQESVTEKTKLAYIQRSTGYSNRGALTLSMIEAMSKAVKKKNPHIVVFVDNCYGEFINEHEPLAYGADLIAGSLIKNPGGGLALTGGYVAGRGELVDKAASRLTAPGIAYEVGANLGTIRSTLQGLFLAPSTVASALKGAILTAKVFQNRGYQVIPTPEEERSDIIQAIVLGDKKKVEAYCRAVQSASPVDSFVAPVAWDMPGYEDEVIMAAGNFIQGSSIELSADAPMREPYIVYQQGGLTYEHVKIALAHVLEAFQ